MGLVFFLGAGASVAANVPATFEMVDRFITSLKDDSQARKATEEIIGRLRSWSEEKSGRPVADIELLLDVLDRLLTPGEDPILGFYDHAEYALSGHPPDVALRSKLRNFIKHVCIVDAADIVYLDPFRQFIRLARPVDVFTVNYDTAVEQFASSYKLRYVDGFDLEWNPGVFERQCDLRLYKLHGSITWYLSDRGTYLKVPVLTDEDTISLVTRERARSLIVYPARKWQTSEPLLDLLVRLRKALESADIAIVVGYSFRDDHIRDIFWDAARKNPDLRVLLVGPGATRIAEDRLARYPEGQPSALAERLVTLPYRFEIVFPVLHDQFISPLSTALGQERDASSKELSGAKPDWASPLREFARAEDVVSAERVALRSGPPEELQVATEVCMRLWIGNWLRGRAVLARRYLLGFLRSVAPYEPSRLEIQFHSNPAALAMYFKHSQTGSYGGSGIRSVVLALSECLRFRSLAVADNQSAKVRDVLAHVEPLHEYLAPWTDGKIDAPEYIHLRGEDALHTGISELTARLQTFGKREPLDLLKDVPARILAFERPLYDRAWQMLSSLSSVDFATGAAPSRPPERAP